MADTGKGKKGLTLGAPEPTDGSKTMELTPELVTKLFKRIEALEAERNTLIDEREARLEAERAPGTQDANESRPSSRVRYRIIVEEGREKNAESHVFVGVNGRGYSIKRGVAVDVPPEVVENLKDAIIITSVAIVDEERNIVVGSQEKRVRRYPYTVLGKSRDEKGNKLMEDEVVSLDGTRMM